MNCCRETVKLGIHGCNNRFMKHPGLEEGLAESLKDIAKMGNLSRARVAQIQKLLKFPADVKEFLASSQDPMEISRYSERRLRGNLTGEATVKRLIAKKYDSHMQSFVNIMDFIFIARLSKNPENLHFAAYCDL